MKKLMAAVLALVLVLGIFAPATLRASEIAVTIDGVAVQFDVPPQIFDGRTMVPVRGVFEALGFEVDWCPYVRQTTLIRDGDVIVITVDSAAFTTNDISHSLDVPAQIIGDRTMLPIRAVLESVGYNVGWDDEANTVAISTPRVIAIAPGFHTSMALMDNGDLWKWTGHREYPRYRIGITPTRIMDDVTAVALGVTHTVAIRTDGNLWGWGNNFYGQLGYLGIRFHTEPVKLMENVIAVSASYGYTMAIRYDGSLWAWGSNHFGQLGDGTTTDRYFPVRIMDDVAKVSAGGTHTLALKTDGSLWAWGSNVTGQIGRGDFGNVGLNPEGTAFIPLKQLSPMKVMDGVIDISAYLDVSVAVIYDGSLWAWGSESFFHPSESWTFSDLRHIPTRVMEDVVAVSAGDQHRLMLRRDGSLWAWGNNAFGQLGDGTNYFRDIPVRVMGDVVAVSAVNQNTMAIRTDGSVWAWGEGFGNSPIRIMDGIMLP